MALSIGARLGPYEVISPLGAGGMGEVYKARDVRLGRDVAIKVIPEEFFEDKNRKERFEREARTLAGLSHPGIAVLYSFEEIFASEASPGRHLLVMELLEGESLRARLDNGALPTRKAVEFAVQIANGLAAAHEKGIVHRDLKPENLFVTKEGRVKILDFGLAKLTQPQGSGPALTQAETTPAGTETGVVLGTAGYMSPEQVQGLAADHRSDIFSLGAVLYEMLSGNRAFKGASAIETLHAILKDDPSEISGTQKNVSPSIERIVRRCLEKSPGERFQSARDVAFALEALSGSKETRPALDAEPPRRSPRRLATAVALPLATLLLGLAAGSFALRPPPPSIPKFQRVTFRPANIFRARFGPDGQTIFYGASVDGRPVEIFTARLGSKGSRPLGIAPADVWSVSSGGELAVSMGQDSRSGTLGRVSLMGGAPREVLENVEWADWAPDGKSLAVLRNIEGKKRLEFPIGKVLCESKGGPRVIQVSPRGNLVAFNDGASLAVVDLQGVKRDLTKSAPAFAWSPDGDEVWFQRSGAGTTEIRAVSLRGKERFVASLPGDLGIFDLSKDKRLLVEQGADRFDVAGRFSGEKEDRDLSFQDATIPGDFSADGKALLFSEKELGWGQSEVYLRKADGSPPVHLGKGFGRALSPDGKWALVLPGSPSSHLVLMPTGAGEARTLPSDGLEPFALVPGNGCGWFPDGKRIVFTASAVGHGPQLWVQDVSGGMPRAFTAEGVRLQMSASPVSPDGQLVFAAGPGGRALYPIDGGPPRPIPGLNEGERLLRWSADGRSFYVLVDLKIGLLDLATGKRRMWKELRPPGTATADDLFFVLLTPDGQGYVQIYQRWLADLYVVDGLR